MTHEIKKVAVIGAGAMGAGIAAQSANAGYDVVLLDKFPDAADNAVERMKKAKPQDVFNAGFMVPENAKRIVTGTTEDDMGKIADADIVIEAVFEELEIKHAVFGDIYKHAKKEAVIASNTSTIELENLVEGFPQDFKERFLNTHFFNPPRFMHLLEIIAGNDTAPDVLERARRFGDEGLGKKVVLCKDSPGFIGNRIGIYAIERAKHEALKQDIKIEDVDAIMGESFGFPKLGLFKLADTVGIDIVYHVGENLQAALPADDQFNAIREDADKLKAMIDDGYTGRYKGKGGFYRESKDENGKKQKEVRNLVTNEFRPYEESEYFKKTVWKKQGSHSAFFDSDDRAAGFAWPVLRDVLLYTMNHAGEFAHDVQAIDDAMRSGFNWKKGPFELLDTFGVAWFKDKLAADGFKSPALLEKVQGTFYKEQNGEQTIMNFDGAYKPVARDQGVVMLEDIKRKSKPLVSGKSASLWDIGEGVTCFEFHSPMNSLEPSVMKAMNDSIRFMNENQGTYNAMVIYNDAENFSVGANLHLIDAFMKASKHPLIKKLGLSGYINKQAMKFVGEMIYQGQSVFKAMREAPFPVIAAPKGTPENMTFGGGCEVLLWSDSIQAGPETVIGLVEAGVGLVPAWGGTTRYLERAIHREGQKNGPMPAVIESAMALANPMQSLSTSAQDAKKKLWLRPEDGITMNPDRVLSDAKNRAMALAKDYTPPAPSTFNLPGASGKYAINMNVDGMYLKGGNPQKGALTPVDLKIIDGLADILSGGETISFAEIDEHVAATQQDRIKEMSARAPDHKVQVHAGIELTEKRLLALEWQRIMTLARDPDTQARIAHMTKTNKPLREDRVDPVPSSEEMRDSINLVDKFDRVPSGKPLSGRDARLLGKMANITETALDRKNGLTLLKLALLR